MSRIHIGARTHACTHARICTHARAHARLHTGSLASVLNGDVETKGIRECIIYWTMPDLRCRD
eukprot:2036889-Pleurochrysis_carterae.AAC.3